MSPVSIPRYPNSKVEEEKILMERQNIPMEEQFVLGERFDVELFGSPDLSGKGTDMKK